MDFVGSNPHSMGTDGREEIDTVGRLTASNISAIHFDDLGPTASTSPITMRSEAQIEVGVGSSLYHLFHVDFF